MAQVEFRKGGRDGWNLGKGTERTAGLAADLSVSILSVPFDPNLPFPERAEKSAK